MKRYALIEHHYRGGHYGEELWSQVSMDECVDGNFVNWADYEAHVQQLEHEVAELKRLLDIERTRFRDRTADYLKGLEVS